MSNKTKIALLGYGSMGKEIKAIAKDQMVEITDIFDINTPINPNKKYDFDVAIDFTMPSAVIENVAIIAEMKKNIVIGTTGWNDFSEIVFDTAKKAGIGLIYGSNYSIGMLIFRNLVIKAAQQLNHAEGFDIMMTEIHHKRKKDSPSGTALSLGSDIITHYPVKDKIVTDVLNEKIAENALHISSLRGGEIAGTHTIYIDSISETIELIHRAKNRKGFAVGALTAAKWLHGKKGVFEFSDIMKSKFED